MAKKTGESSTPEVKAKSARNRKLKAATANSAAPKAPKLVATATPSNVTTMPAPTDVYQRIRERAYEIFQARGGEHGYDQADWLQAEAEIVGHQRARTA